MTWIFSCVSTVLLGVAQQGGLPTTRVAVVNIPKVSERYLKTADLEAALKQRHRLFNEARDAKQKEVERARRSLQEELKPGTAAFEDRRKEIFLLQGELQWFTESEGRKIEEGMAASLRNIYDDIHGMVRQLAEERGIEVVLAADQLPPTPPKTTAEARQQIVLQNVLYWHPRVDLTGEVVSRLNASYQAAKLKKP